MSSTPRCLAAAGLLTTLTACVHLNSVAMTQIPAERTTVVTAESSKMIILGLNFDNDFVDDVRKQLKDKCEGGQVKGILTKDEVVDYFLFVQRRRINAEGYCIKDGGGRVMRQLILLAAVAFGGCAASLHEVHVSDITPGTNLGAGKEVSSAGEQFVVLGCVGNTTYVDEARSALLATCPRGRIEGITTQYTTDLGFLSWTNRVLMKGICVSRT